MKNTTLLGNFQSVSQFNGHNGAVKNQFIIQTDKRRIMPNDIYDHFSHSFRNPVTWDRVSTETWLHTHEVKRRCKDILLGVVSVVCMAIMSLAVIILIWR
jgi:hypothetical protein